MIDKEVNVGKIGWDLYVDKNGWVNLTIHSANGNYGMFMLPADAELLKDIGEGFNKIAQVLEKKQNVSEAGPGDE